MLRIEWGLPCCLLLTAMAGCSEHDAGDFCSAHASEHWQHAAQAARLELHFEADGKLRAQFTGPARALGLVANEEEGQRQPPVDFAQVFTLQNDASCRQHEGEMDIRNGQVDLTYGLSCGADFKFEHLSISLLQHYEALQEVDVTVQTEAVSKHFLIHRDCEAALFNLKNQVDSR